MALSVRSKVVCVIVLVCAAAAADEVRKPAGLTLINKAKDIQVIADRDQPILDWFRGQRVLVGRVVPEELKKILEAKEPLSKMFISYASQNDDPARTATFGATLEIAPPDAAVVQLINQRKPDGKQKLNLTLILRRDEKNPNLYYVVGCTDRTPVGFFDNDKKNPADGFSQKDLLYRGGRK